MKNVMKIRTIEDICKETPFAGEYNGNVYCSIGFTKQIMCRYHSKETDCNGFYYCLNPLYNFKPEIGDYVQ